MFKSGTTWSIKPIGKWLDEQKQYTNCIKCGHDIIDCFVEYLRIISKLDWTVMDRKINKFKDFKSTKIYDICEGIDFDDMN